MTNHRGPDRLPIWRDTQCLLLVIEPAVRTFPQYHKYALGSDMRRQAMSLSRLLVLRPVFYPN